MTNHLGPILISVSGSPGAPGSATTASHSAVWLGLSAASKSFDVVEDEYDELRSVYEIGHRAGAARLLLLINDPHPDVIRSLVGAAILGGRDAVAGTVERRRQRPGEFDAKVRTIRAPWADHDPG